MTEPPERILVLTSSYPRFEGEAAGHFIKSEVRALERSGHEVTVVAAGGPFDDPNVRALGGSELFQHPGALPRLRQKPTRAAQLLSVTNKVRDLAAELGPMDRIVCHWLLPCAVPWGLLLSTKIPEKECVAHGSDVRLLLRLPRWVRVFVLRRLREQGFRLRFVAAELKRELSGAALPSSLARYVARAQVVPSPIECDDVPSRHEARRQLGLGPDDEIGVFVGRLIDEKRPRVALSAASLIPNLQMVVIGSGPLEDALRATHTEARFLGQLSRALALTWIAAADVLITASREEGAPTVIREARSLGTAVVSVPAGDAADWAKSDAGLWIAG